MLGQLPNVRTCVHDLRFILQKLLLGRLGVSKRRTL